MTIVLINADMLKVSLSEEDLAGLSVEIDELDASGEEARTLLAGLLEKAREQTGFRIAGAKLFIRIFPDRRGGCTVLYTALRSKLPVREKAGIEPVVFAFDDADNLCIGSVGLFTRYGHRIYKSSLYRYKNEYVLTVYPLDYLDRLSLYFLSEYARKVGEGDLFASFIEEHADSIVEDHAIETLADYFA